MRLSNLVPAIPANIVASLDAIGVRTEIDLLFSGSTFEIYNRLPANTLTLRELTEYTALAAELCAAPGTTAQEALRLEKEALTGDDELRSGLEELDELLRGLGSGKVIEISGDKGSGKTTLALNIILHHLASQPTPGTAVWVDTTGDFSSEKALNILACRQLDENILERVQVVLAFDIDFAQALLEDLSSRHDVPVHRHNSRVRIEALYLEEKFAADLELLHCARFCEPFAMPREARIDDHIFALAKLVSFRTSLLDSPFVSTRATLSIDNNDLSLLYWDAKGTSVALDILSITPLSDALTLRQRGLRFLVIDTITPLLGPLFSAVSAQGHAIMTDFMRQLQAFARKLGVTVFVINNTSGHGLEDNKRKPALGPSFVLLTDTSLWLQAIVDTSAETDAPILHSLQIVKSRSKPTGCSMTFCVRDSTVSPVLVENNPRS
ncbi:hypothetical protein D9613_007604 [Agrocybe pediades]|uniref:Rad51-like C-terminal domain-containing protein n=1 Tax=Agrocybe pediades TaxID=84607 RepID=A0A8H4VMY1_9AGAR|nr:hypothetical protein D9613_007604 [Agrocybe pediades]